MAEPLTLKSLVRTIRAVVIREVYHALREGLRSCFVYLHRLYIRTSLNRLSQHIGYFGRYCAIGAVRTE